MRYIFHPEEDLIPKAVFEAVLREPAEEIREEWENAIYKDLEHHRMNFSWFTWLRGMLP